MLLTGQEKTGQCQAEWISGREFGLEREDGLLKGIEGRRREREAKHVCEREREGKRERGKVAQGLSDGFLL